MCIEKCIDIIKHTDCLQNILFYIATYFRHFTESSKVKIIISRIGFAFQSPQWAGKRKKKQNSGCKSTDCTKQHMQSEVEVSCLFPQILSICSLVLFYTKIKMLFFLCIFISIHYNCRVFLNVCFQIFLFFFFNSYR